MSYSIISTIINQYDIPFPNYDTIAEQRLLLSDTNYNVSGWDIRLLNSVNHDKPFNTVFNVRWHPFNYCNTDYIIWIDGSLEVKKTLEPLIQEFADSGADIGLLKHPARSDIFTEYATWINLRNYPKSTAYRWMALLEKYKKCDIYNSGLVETKIIIYKHSSACIKWCNYVWEFLHALDQNNVDRLDQTIVTALMNDISTYIINPSVYTHGLYFNSHYNH